MFGIKRIKQLTEQVRELELLVSSLSKAKFRVGDKVYVNDGVRNPLSPFYLRKAFNNGENYYISASPDGIIYEGVNYAVRIGRISHDKPGCCASCGSPLK